MKKNNFVFFLSSIFFIFSVIAWAEEEAVFKHPLNAQTRNTFNSICAKIAEKPVVKGNFSQEKYLKNFERSLNSTGNFIIAAEYGMVWETLKPFPSTMVLGNDFILQSRPDGQKSVLSAQGNETFTQMAGVLSAVFTGNGAGLLDNFTVYFLGSVSDWNIGLIPKDKVIASFAEKITMSGNEIAVNGASGTGASEKFAAINTIRIYEQSGDIITYSLQNHFFPAELNNNEKDFFKLP